MKNLLEKLAGAKKARSNVFEASLIALLVEAVVYPVFGPIYLLAVPNAHDGFFERVLFCIPSACLFILLLVKKNLRSYSQLFAGIGYLFIFIHIFTLLVRNHLNPTYVMGFYVVVNVSISIFTEIPIILAESLFSILGGIVVVYLVTEPQMKILIFFSLLIVEATLSTVVNIQKLSGYFQIEKQKERLLESERLASLGILASGVAHEINNPLSVINLKLAILVRKLKNGESDNEFVIKTVQGLQEVVTQVATIVSKLNKFAETATNEKGVNKTKILDAIENAKIFYASRMSSALIRIETQSPESYWVAVELVQLTQLFSAMLSNSIDAIEKLDEDQRWIKIFVRATSSDIIVKFTDGGIGIPEHVAKNIFVPFFTTKEPGQGTGTALSITKVSIERLGGSLRLVRDAKNTEFEITFPRA